MANPILNALKFVKGAVSEKGNLPALAHFRISNGRVLGFNGTLAISSPIDIALNVAPKASEFVKAIDACKDSEQITLQQKESGKLLVKTEGFSSFVPCDDKDKFPEVHPVGPSYNLANCQILPALDYLKKFISDDEQRPWSCSVLLDRMSAYATNNVTVVQYWLSGLDIANRIAIPSAAVKELLRIGVEPSYMQVDSRSITFHYKDSRWIRTRTIGSPWPDIEKLLSTPSATPPVKFTEELFEAIEQLFPFTDELNRVYFLGDRISTVANPKENGTSVRVDCPEKGIFPAKQLLALRGIAESIAFDDYPLSVPFWGKLTRGRVAPFTR